MYRRMGMPMRNISIVPTVKTAPAISPPTRNFDALICGLWFPSLILHLPAPKLAQISATITGHANWNFRHTAGVFKLATMLSLRAAAIAMMAVLCVRAERMEFEVASVKPSHGVRGGSIARTPGGLVARNAPFSTLIEMAFQTKLLDLSAVPDSLRSQPFDIVAKAPGKISGDQYWAMLQSLLEDRFQLKYHRQTKDA